MAKTPIQLREIDLGLAERLDNVVESSYIDVPFTTITNRAKIRDFANDLRPRIGVERIGAQQAEILSNEVGPNGESVYSVENDLLDRVRFIGDISSNIDASGSSIVLNTTDAAIEVTFYGTGLNILCRSLTVGPRVTYVTVDGGVEDTTNVYPVGSTVLDSRNYNQNQLSNAVSGLSQGLHTVRLRNVSGGGQYLSVTCPPLPVFTKLIW